jgi:formyltetrahydrofolate hydrolase
MVGKTRPVEQGLDTQPVVKQEVDRVAHGQSAQGRSQAD